MVCGGNGRTHEDACVVHAGRAGRATLPWVILLTCTATQPPAASDQEEEEGEGADRCGRGGGVGARGRGVQRGCAHVGRMVLALCWLCVWHVRCFTCVGLGVLDMHVLDMRSSCVPPTQDDARYTAIRRATKDRPSWVRACGGFVFGLGACVRHTLTCVLESVGWLCLRYSANHMHRRACPLCPAAQEPVACCH